MQRGSDTAGGREASAVLPRDHSFVLSERARRHYWQGEGLLSIKAFFAGEALYRVDGVPRVVDTSGYLLLNEGQTYTVEIEQAAAVESFCVFFASGAAEEVRRSLDETPETLLANPTATATGPMRFFDRLYPHDTIVTPALLALRAEVAGTRAGAADGEQRVAERLHLLLLALLRAHGQTSAEAHALPMARASTREETYRRLHHAADYARAMLHQPLPLEALAGVAAMSPTHFLRTFSQAFHQTPHAYVTALRMERAQTLLRQTDRSVTDIGLAVGFASLGAFSWRFRKQVGLSPQQYRAAHTPPTRRAGCRWTEHPTRAAETW